MRKNGELIRFEVSVPTTASPQEVYDVLADLRTHLEWAGRRSTQKSFRLLELDAPHDPAVVGTRFSSTGANNNGTFHDSSVVTEASPPHVLEFRTDSRLHRKHAKEWRVTFTHRYEVHPAAGDGARVDYTAVARDGSYLPWWLVPGMRPMTRVMVGGMIRRQMRNLARLAEERSRVDAS